MRVLIIEDHISIQEVMKRLLESCVTSVEVVSTMMEAKASLVKNDVDVAIVDLSLPDSTVDQTIDAVPELRLLNPGVILIAMSGVVPVEKLEEYSQRAGFDDYLHKYEVAERPRQAILGTIARASIRANKQISVPKPNDCP